VANEVGSVDDGFGVGTRRISSRAEAIGSARRVSLCGLTIRVMGRGGDAGSGVPFAGVAAVGGGEKGSLRACPEPLGVGALGEAAGGGGRPPSRPWPNPNPSCSPGRAVGAAMWPELSQGRPRMYSRRLSCARCVNESSDSRWLIRALSQGMESSSWTSPPTGR
jgi:hypothetical protein